MQQTWNDLYTNSSQICPHVRKTWVALGKYLLSKSYSQRFKCNESWGVFLFLTLPPSLPRYYSPAVNCSFKLAIMNISYEALLQMCICII